VNLYGEQQPLPRSDLYVVGSSVAWCQFTALRCGITRYQSEFSWFQEKYFFFTVQDNLEPASNDSVQQISREALKALQFTSGPLRALSVIVVDGHRTLCEFHFLDWINRCV
jgi:hypothetical protein